MFGVRFRVRVRYKVRIIVTVIVRVNSFGDYISVLVRAQHRSPTSDHNSSRALTVCFKTLMKYELQQQQHCEATGWDTASGLRRP